MMNDRNKELLSVTDKNLDAVKKQAFEQKEGLGDFLLQKFACLINNDSTKSDWRQMTGDQLANASAFQLAIRSSDGNKLTQAWMEEVRTAITGGDDAKKHQGAIF